MTQNRKDLPESAPKIKNSPDVLLERDVTDLYHFAQGKQWLDIVRNKDENIPLSYCAFEFRIALERVAFELLIQIRGSSFDDTDKKASKKLKNIHKRIHDLEGHQRKLDRKYEFLKILLEIAGYEDFPLAKVNLSVLTKYWDFCSAYCHMQYDLPSSWGNSAFVDKCFEGLCEIEKFLEDIVRNVILWPQWSEDPWINSLLSQYIEGRINDVELIAELKKRGVWGKVIRPDDKAIFLSDFKKQVATEMSDN